MKCRAVMILGLLALSACGKSVEIGSVSISDEPRAIPTFPVQDPSDSTDPTGPTASCRPEDRFQWRFTQPDEVINRAVDLLFVADSSDSLSSERAQVAAQVGSFVAGLSPDTDFKVGVMLGHGLSSSYSGKVYASGAGFESALSRMVSDRDKANGEALLSSFLKSLDSNEPFYRADAALAVIFISDENDICFAPKDHGFTAFPDFVASTPSTLETQAYKSNCLDPNGQLRVTPEAVLAKLREKKPEGRFSIGAITHQDPALVPRGAGSEDSIGHGFLELAALAPRSEVIELESSSYASGLRQLGDMSSRRLDLRTVFDLQGLPDGRKIVSGTVSVKVDGKAVSATYTDTSMKVEVALKDAGSARSEVRVDACARAPSL